MELFLDIETMARPGAEALLPEPQAPANYKDEAKIAAYVEEAKTKQREKMALDVDCCQVVTIGWERENQGVYCLDAELVGSERELLDIFWEEVADRKNGASLASLTFPVGYNIGEFDLPVLYRRSFLLGVLPSARWEYRRYQKAPVLDLMQVFYHWLPPYRGLRFVCQLCGIEPPMGEGAEVATMTPEQRIAHCTSDVEAIRALYERGRGYYW